MAKIFKLDRWRRDGSHFILRFLSVSILHIKKLKNRVISWWTNSGHDKTQANNNVEAAAYLS